ncbi:Os01g0677400, partial [Oryza sativa Japonica Group]
RHTGNGCSRFQRPRIRPLACRSGMHNCTTKTTDSCCSTVLVLNSVSLTHCIIAENFSYQLKLSFTAIASASSES